MAQFFGNPANGFRRPGMRFLGELQMGDRVPGETIRSTLKHDEVWPVFAQVILDLRPLAIENLVGGPGRNGQIEFGSRSLPK